MVADHPAAAVAAVAAPVKVHALRAPSVMEVPATRMLILGLAMISFATFVVRVLIMGKAPVVQSKDLDVRQTQILLPLAGAVVAAAVGPALSVTSLTIY